MYITVTWCGASVSCRVFGRHRPTTRSCPLPSVEVDAAATSLQSGRRRRRRNYTAARPDVVPGIGPQRRPQLAERETVPKTTGRL